MIYKYPYSRRTFYQYFVKKYRGLNQDDETTYQLVKNYMNEFHVPLVNSKANTVKQGIKIDRNREQINQTGG